MYQKNLLLSFSLFVVCLLSSAYADSHYEGCPPVNSPCGPISTISYPFWDGRKLPEYCGDPSFKLDCGNDSSATIKIDNHNYTVQAIKYAAKVLTISSPQFLKGPCPPSPSMLTNTSLDNSLFSLTSNSQDAFLFYDCQPTNQELIAPYGFSCSTQNSSYSSDTSSSILFSSTRGYLATNNTTWLQELRKNCSFEVYLPILTYQAVKLANSASGIKQVLSNGFEVKWTIDDGQCDECMKSGGRCGFNQISKQFACFCKNGDQGTTCNKSMGTAHAYAPTPRPPTSPTGEKKSRKINLTVAIGAGVAVAACVLMSSILCFVLSRRRYKKNSSSQLLTHNKSYGPSSATSNFHVLNGSTVFGVHVFNYRELEEATEYFNPLKELGEGGFGTVYYGKLRDGREVAIKRLYENNNKRAEQFLNEVEILANLCHKNLVNLYGCTSRQSRELLLVYEYVPNGTVADHLHGKQSKHGLLPWATRLSIATETASALVYLHDSDIVHRDVKTQNILLDKNFSVKVADFGLSRLFPLDVTHVSTAPQGTPGYVDPEYHQCYQLTEKSDVYSFGVMLAELLSSLPAVDITRKRNEINLSNMAINKIQNCLHEFVDPSLGFQSDCRVKQEITAVAELVFQCLQSTKEMRPTMNEVLKRLLLIQDEQGSEADSAEVVDIPADDVLMLKGDLSPIVSPPREDPLVTRYKLNASV